MLDGKQVLLGVCGGIAVYKVVDLARRLIKLGANVKVIMTENAAQFVTPLTFETITGNEVTVGMFDSVKNWDVKHISLANSCDICVAAPATANLLGKLAHGIADDMLTTTILATKAPVLLAPAMNTNMYENAAVNENIKILKDRGFSLIEPGTGLLACRVTGKGKLPEPDDIVKKVIEAVLPKQDFKGKHIVITAGPTQEAIDPVRFLSNHSSGKMGYALAEAAGRRGGEVTLISGPVSLDTPLGVNRIDVTTADEMFAVTKGLYEKCDMIFFVAAVSDYRCRGVSPHKIKKRDQSSASGEISIILEENPDIAAEIGKIKKNAIHVGMCAETENVHENAIKKLKEKNFDIIMSNDVTKEGAGFNSDTNIVTLFNTKGVKKELPKMKKIEVADLLLDFVIESEN